MNAVVECVVVTGAASGIGAAVVRALLRDGYHVVAFDRDEAVLPGKLAHLPKQLRCRVLDVTDPDAVDAAVNEVEQTIGAIVGLVNSAGVLPLGSLSGPDFSMHHLRQAFAVNVEGVQSMSRAVARHMVTRRRGSIVTVSSNAASTPRIGMGAYCVTKAAASMLTRCLGLELAGFGVRCNVVSPGSTDTPMLRSLLDEKGHARVIEGEPKTFRLGIPLGRVADASDVAEAILFLLSERSRHVTLHDLRVDGGATL